MFSTGRKITVDLLIPNEVVVMRDVGGQLCQFLRRQGIDGLFYFSQTHGLRLAKAGPADKACAMRDTGCGDGGRNGESGAKVRSEDGGLRMENRGRRTPACIAM